MNTIINRNNYIFKSPVSLTIRQLFWAFFVLLLCVSTLPVRAQQGEPNPKMVSLLKALAAEGNAEAQYYLGLAFEKGDGVPKSSEDAARWYLRAGEQGHAKAQLFLGLLYEEGEGVQRNGTDAAKWYRRAAIQGNPLAQTRLGLLYSIGRGVPKSHSEAYFWLNLAAAQGEEGAGRVRDALSQEMTRQEISDAQRRSAAWKPRRE